MRNRVLMAAVFCLCGLFATAGPALAQSEPWPPSFQLDQHVYVDGALKNHASDPVNFSAMSAEIENLSKAHGLAVYVVAIQRDFPEGKVIAKELLDELLDQWEARSDFPAKDFVVVLWVRQEHNPAKGSVAAGVGSKLKGWGFTAARLTDKVKGPVTPALKQFMPRNPQQALLQIVRNINQGSDVYLAAQEQAERDKTVAAQKAEQERIAAVQRAEQERITAAKDAERRQLARAQAQKEEEAARAAFQSTMWMLLGGGTIAAIFIGLLVYWLIKRSQSAHLIAEYRGKFDIANVNYIQLEGAYLDFLKAQGTDWKSKFKNETLVLYTSAVQDFAALSVRMRLAQQRLQQAEESHNRAYFLIPSGYSRAIALLKEDDVTISSGSLPQETVKLFESVVVNQQCKPAQLLAEMEQLFTHTNTALASIMKAFDGAEQNRKDIEDLQKQISGMQKTLEDAGLSFEPYRQRCESISVGQQAVLAILTCDPVAAYSKSESVEADAGAIKSDINRAIVLKKSLAESKIEIDAARQRAADVRAQLCDPRDYPEAGDTVLEVGRYQLLEQGGNPDPALEAAATHFSTAEALLLSAELDRCEVERQSALSSSQQAAQLVQNVLDARTFVVQQLCAVRLHLKELIAENPAGEEAVGALAAGFLPENFGDAPQKLNGCKTVAQNSESNLVTLRGAFFEQRFLAARKMLETTSGSIAGARKQLLAIHECLRILRGLKQAAKDDVAKSATLSVRIGGKLKENAFTTAVTTAATYAGLSEQLSAQQANVGGNEIIDWPAAASTAKNLYAGLQSVELQIASEKQAYDSAGQDLRRLSTAVSSGVRFDADTRNQARNKLMEASAELNRLQSAYRIEKSDWIALSRQAATALTAVSEAQRLADLDRQAAESARSAIEDAQATVTGSNRSYVQTACWNNKQSQVGQKVAADLSQSGIYLEQARRSLRSQNYESASQSASQAKSSAQEAQQAANQAVTALVTAAILVWQQAERAAESQRPAERVQQDAENAAAQPTRSPVHYQPQHQDSGYHPPSVPTHTDTGHHHQSGGDNYGGIHDSSPPSSSHDTGGDNY